MVHERSASEKVRRVALSGDRARRLSLAARLITRVAPPAAAVVCAASTVAALFGGPRTLGLFLIAAIAACAALVLLAARRERPVSDALVAELDGAANLGGDLRSAHWFADPARSVPDDAEGAWVAFHLDQAAVRAEGVDWNKVYARPSARRHGLTTLAFALATVGVAVWPWTPILTRSPQVVASSAPGVSAPALSPSLVPTIVDGMRAMKSGQTPSHESLAAIGQALELAKTDRTMQEQIEGLFDRVGADGTDATGFYSDSDRDPREDQYNNGFQIAALDWAYREAVARQSADGQTSRDARRQSSSAGAADDGKPGERDADAPGSGASVDAPVQADIRGQAATFSSVLFGRQQAAGEAGRTASEEPSARAATLAMLRKEVVHARSDLAGARAETGGARRATNAGRTARTASDLLAGVSYDRARATQPLAVPEARRSLVHDFFLRPAPPR